VATDASVSGRQHISVRWRERLFDSELSSTARLVGCVLAHHVDQHGCCWPSVETIAREGGLATSTVKERLNELEHGGFLRRHPGGGNGKTNRYWVLLPSNQPSPGPFITGYQPGQAAEPAGSHPDSGREAAPNYKNYKNSPDASASTDAVGEEHEINGAASGECHDAAASDGRDLTDEEKHRHLSQVRSWRYSSVSGLPAAHDGPCQDCGKTGARVIYGRAELCHGCAEKRAPYASPGFLPERRLPMAEHPLDDSDAGRPSAGSDGVDEDVAFCPTCGSEKPVKVRRSGLVYLACGHQGAVDRTGEG
jgi:hypothetical protein